jgi:ribonuclease BN (tRNA processing enzyme)
MKLHVLGVGTPDSREERYGSAFLLEMDEPNNQIMIDCGPASTYKMACMGLSPKQVRQLFLTHHHYDHNADVPCFALTRWDQLTAADDIPLHVFGPPPTAAFFERLFGEQGAYREDWVAQRADAHEPGWYFAPYRTDFQCEGSH